ncbi:hypothetical protein MNB_SUP05-SYMBIONT-5-697 [hydrothermal vent metagenome]|uniref:Uncharacterized protein n=1 Tax=hydrothermal vent metagenome TaxID=652676 RepID=A0A1W1E2Z0_9ZZZZ
MDFKEYCIGVGMTENSASGYSSMSNTGIQVLKDIVSGSDAYNKKALIQHFLDDPNSYQEKFEEGRNNVKNCFRDFVSVAKKYLAFLADHFHEDVLKWHHKSGGETWEPFIKLRPLHKYE